MKASVNAFLSMQKALLTRRGQLEAVKNSSAMSTSYYSQGVETRVEKPTYDIKAADRMITKINRALFEIDTKVKQSNAVTEIDIALDFDDLMKELS